MLIDTNVAERHEAVAGPGLRHGDESICSQLTPLNFPIAHATYSEHCSRASMARDMRAVALKPPISAVKGANSGVFRAHEVRLTVSRERAADAPPIARCTVERLMTGLGAA